MTGAVLIYCHGNPQLARVIRPGWIECCHCGHQMKTVTDFGPQPWQKKKLRVVA